MSKPGTEAEEAAFLRLSGLAGPAENAVSTACPGCGERFALLGTYGKDGWRLRCTRCAWHGRGILKEREEEASEQLTED